MIYNNLDHKSNLQLEVEKGHLSIYRFGIFFFEFEKDVWVQFLAWKQYIFEELLVQTWDRS